MTSAAEPAVPRVELADRLRTYRETRKPGYTKQQVAKELVWNRTKISQLETGKTGVKDEDLVKLLDYYGEDDPVEREYLRDLAKQGKQVGWWAPLVRASGAGQGYSTYIRLESGAVGLDCYDASVFFGLFQTRAYMEAVISQACPDDSLGKVAAKSKLRQERQARMEAREIPLRLRVVIDESVLRRRIGGTAVLREQLQALIAAAKRENVQIRVVSLSSGVNAGMLSSFTVVKLKGELPPVVFVEGLTGDVYPPAEDRPAYTLAFETLWNKALDPASSMNLMLDALHELDK